MKRQNVKTPKRQNLFRGGGLFGPCPISVAPRQDRVLSEQRPIRAATVREWLVFDMQ